MKAKAFLVGGFNRTIFLANSLIKKGYNVTAINTDKDKCRVLSEIDKLKVFNGDGSKPYVLEEANMYDADIAIALTDRDEDNLVICELCKKKFHVKKTVALISDPKKTDFFYRVGIDSVVCAVSMIATVIEQQALLDEMTTQMPIAEGRIIITQIHISENYPVVNKKLSEIDLPRQVIVGCVLRGDSSVVPRGDTRILVDDVLVLISASGDETAALDKLTGR